MIPLAVRSSTNNIQILLSSHVALILSNVAFTRGDHVNLSFQWIRQFRGLRARVLNDGRAPTRLPLWATTRLIASYLSAQIPIDLIFFISPSQHNQGSN